MIDFLSVLTNNDIEPIAIENVLNAKLTQLVASKNVRFKQYSHSKPMPLGYYALVFLPSGAGKDQLLRLIDNNLMPFLKEKLTKIVDEYKNEVFQNEVHKGDNKDAKEKREIEKQANELVRKIRCCNINISDATYTGLYYEAEQISKTKYGSIFIKMTELGDRIDNAVKGDGNTKELLEKTKDIADGDFSPRITAGEVRKNISGIAVSGYFCCDYKTLTKERNNEFFISWVDTGMGRRSFCYMPKEQNKINKPTNWQEREKALIRATEISKELENIYDAIPKDMICEFSAAAKSMLNKFELDCIDEFNKIYLIDDTRAKEVKGAFWKVTKLSVVKSVLENPTHPIVDTKYVQEAISFYKRIQPCLQLVIEKKAESPEDKLKKYLMKKENGETISRVELDKQRFGHKGTFKVWIDDVMPDICEELGTIYGYKGKGNSKGWQVRK